jgi:hypothetical protein
MNHERRKTMRRPTRCVLAIAVSLQLAACGGGAIEETAEFDFTRGSAGWTGGSSDYSVATEPVDVAVELRSASSPHRGMALYMAGTNRSDDLFVYAKRRVSGLAPYTRYRVGFSIRFLTNVGSQCAGAGGPPGEAVTVKMGASRQEPLTLQQGSDFVLNVDKGNQAASGSEAAALGHLAAAGLGCSRASFVEKSLHRPDALSVRTGGRGSAWLMIGLDSGFEGFSQAYIRSATFDFTPD